MLYYRGSFVVFETIVVEKKCFNNVCYLMTMFHQEILVSIQTRPNLPGNRFA